MLEPCGGNNNTSLVLPLARFLRLPHSASDPPLRARCGVFDAGRRPPQPRFTHTETNRSDAAGRPVSVAEFLSTYEADVISDASLRLPKPASTCEAGVFSPQ